MLIPPGWVANLNRPYKVKSRISLLDFKKNTWKEVLIWDYDIFLRMNLLSYVQTDATTPTLMRPAVGRGKDTTHKIL